MSERNLEMRVTAWLVAHDAQCAEYPSPARPAYKRISTVTAPGSDVEHVLTDDDVRALLAANAQLREDLAAAESEIRVIQEMED